MAALRARLFALSIPFKLTFTHAMAKRSDCDSLILELDDGTCRGYGEGLLREYVNGPAASCTDLRSVAERIQEIIEQFQNHRDPTVNIHSLRNTVLNTVWSSGDLPLVSAVEGAFLDLLCQREEKDIYELLGKQPRRQEVVYGGIIPILPDKALDMMVRGYLQHKIPCIRLKLSHDIEYNRRVLAIVRGAAGDDFDVRVDVNCAWDQDEAAAHLGLLMKNRISLVEEPLGPDRPGMKELAQKSEEYGVSYVADESAVTSGDIDAVIEDRSFSMINIRLAKNGGILRSLAIAEKADAAGLRYQLGCHVGETGISSVTGRIAGSLMEDPVYIDGSFDEYILADNITTRSFSFGIGGKAPIVRGNGIGYRIDPEKLKLYSMDVLSP